MRQFGDIDPDSYNSRRYERDILPIFIPRSQLDTESYSDRKASFGRYLAVLQRRVNLDFHSGCILAFLSQGADPGTEFEHPSCQKRCDSFISYFLWHQYWNPGFYANQLVAHCSEIQIETLLKTVAQSCSDRLMYVTPKRWTRELIRSLDGSPHNYRLEWLWPSETPDSNREAKEITDIARQLIMAGLNPLLISVFDKWERPQFSQHTVEIIEWASVVLSGYTKHNINTAEGLEDEEVSWLKEYFPITRDFSRYDSDRFKKGLKQHMKVWSVVVLGRTSEIVFKAAIETSTTLSFDALLESGKLDSHIDLSSLADINSAREAVDIVPLTIPVPYLLEVFGRTDTLVRGPRLDKREVIEMTDDESSELRTAGE